MFCAIVYCVSMIFRSGLVGKRYKKKGGEAEERLEVALLRRVEREEEDRWTDSSEGGTTDGEQEIDNFLRWLDSDDSGDSTDYIHFGDTTDEEDTQKKCVLVRER